MMQGDEKQKQNRRPSPKECIETAQPILFQMLGGISTMIPCASCLPVIPQKPLRDPHRQSCRRDPRKYDAEVLQVIEGAFPGSGEFVPPPGHRADETAMATPRPD